MPNINNDNNMRIYDFNTLKKSFKIQDVSKIKDYTIPEENLPHVKDQGDICCCVACVLAEMLEVFNKIETGDYKELSVGYSYGTHRPKDSTSTGMYIETALNCMLEAGSVPQNIFNLLYEMPDMKKVLQERDDLDKIAIPSRIEGYCKIRWSSLEDKINSMKLALVNFEAPLVARVTGGFPEPHCILVYGIQGNKALIQNSWGKSYGKDGRATYPIEDIEQLYMLMDHKVSLPFEDVPEDAWFYKSILHMYSSGYVSGKTDKKFEPNANITRAEVCSILDRILKNIDSINQSTNVSLEKRFSRLENKVFFDMDECL